MSARELTARKDSLSGVMRDAMARPLADYYMVMAVTAALTGIGLFMVLSASSVYAMVTTGDAYTYGRWQLIVAVVGVVAAIILSRLNQKAYIIIGWLAMGIALLLLLITIIPGAGSSFGGQQAWLKIGFLPKIQPSEFAKAALVLWGASVFAQPARSRNLDNLKSMLLPYLPVSGIVLALVLAEKDLGTAVVIGAIIVLQMWFIGAPGKVMAFLIGGGAAGSLAVLLLSSTHRAKVISFLAERFPFLHLTATSTSDQPNNAIYALATGGWWGTGPGASRQKWGGLYNGAHTDYILAVMGEELGLFGVLIVLVLLFVLVFTAIQIARRSDRLFWRMAACGVAGWIMVQAGINTLVAFGLLPVIGVPFPFLSYGGSALLACFIGIGVLLAAARHEKDARTEIESRRSMVGGVVVARPAK